jgi:MYXO-CTERM domain-containing protein
MPRRLLPLLALLLATPAAADVLAAIDAQFAAGRIDEGTRHVYRVAALRDPGALPPELRSLPRDTASGARLTAVLFEAWRWASRHPRDRGGVVLRDLLLPRQDLPHVFDSAVLPIRVSWSTPAQEALARAVLDTAEISWQVETGDYGFTPPPIEPGADRYRIFVDSTGGFGAAYTAPYAENPATDWTDCYSYIVVDPANPPVSVGATVAHELNHAMQSALDCTEVTTFMENTSTYIMSQVFPAALGETIAYMPYFQSVPWRALDYMNPGASDLYEYGGALFAIYLGETWGSGNGPVFLREIWEDCRQTDRHNSRTYYDAVAHLVGEAGGPATMPEILTDFSESRFFAGRWDDGHHLAGAASFPAVATAAAWAVADLPVRGARPESSEAPAPYGVNHVLVDLTDEPYPLRIDFTGATTTRWAVRAVRAGDGAVLRDDVPIDPTTQAGTLDVDPAGQRSLVLVIENLGAPGYSPNDREWPTATYSYSIERLIPPPTITGADPAAVAQGAADVQVEILGSGFAGGVDFAVAFDDPAVHVLGVLGARPTAVTVVLDVDADAALGPKTVTVTNSGGAQASGPGVTVVAAPTPDGGTGPADGGGCGCRTGRGPRGAAGLALLGLLVGVARRRRRLAP